MKSVVTKKGTELPLIDLKGKKYLMVAYRIQWANEDAARLQIETEVLKMDKDESVVKAKVTILDDQGNVIKSATATKREDSKGFGDHLEKAETGACGRALAMCGYGTQFALSDLDEGQRIVDSPLVESKVVTKEEPKEEKKAINKFRRDTPKPVTTESEDLI